MSIVDDCTPPMVAGLTTQQLQANFNAVQAAILALATGQRVVNVSYAQGDGTKSVGYYSQIDMGTLQVLLRIYGQALGINGRRRAIRPIF